MRCEGERKEREGGRSKICEGEEVTGCRSENNTTLKGSASVGVVWSGVTSLPPPSA